MNTVSLWTIFEMGGFFMWPLLVFSVLTITLIVERTVFLLYHDLKLDDLQSKLNGYILAGDYLAASQWINGLKKRRIGARIFAALMDHAHMSEHLMEKAVDAEAGSNLRKMENGFNFLVALGSLAPLTGFLGTVSGMIGAFKSIAEAPEVNAQIVANGIYEALVTTVFGLIIAIIAIIGHNILTHVVDSFAGRVEQSVSQVIVNISHKEQSQ